MKLNLIIFSAICFFLQSCASNQRTILSDNQRTKIKEVNLYPLIIQDEVRPSIELSNVSGAMGGGLIGAMIDSSIDKSRSKTSEEIIEPLYKATNEVDFRKILGKEIATEVSTVYSLSPRKESAEAILISNTDLKKKIAALNDGQYLLFTSTFYSMMQDSKVLNVETVAFLFEKNAKETSGRPKPIYQNSISYISSSLGSGAGDSISLWSSNKGKAFTDALNEAARETANLLKYDLQSSLKLECGEKMSVSIFGFNGALMKADSILVRETEGRSVVRNIASGWMYSVPKSQAVKIGNNAKCN